MFTSQIWIIRFENHLNRELKGLRGAVRMAAESQKVAEQWANDTLNAWLRDNPGQPGSYTLSAYVEPRD